MSAGRNKATITGVVALSVSLAALAALTFIPTQYVIQQPGPVYDTLGTARAADGTDVPLIEIDGAQSYPTGGALDLTTVQVVGNRERTPTWFELATAWVDSSRAVVPLDSVFPVGVTTEQRDQQNAALMIDSQHEATAAALTELGYDVGAKVVVFETLADTPASGKIDKGDRILAVDGTAITASSQVRDTIQKTEGAEITLTIERNGQKQDVAITPEKVTDDFGQSAWLLGIRLSTDYDFPIDVRLQLDNVGGPSAGMMFALGIIDTLTPGELNGGENIAGTGTIDAAGKVGPIGGIRQKLYGARDAGATVFLAPASNCDEVVGHVPDGLAVYRTETLQESLDIVKTVADGGDTAKLPVCTAKAS